MSREPEMRELLAGADDSNTGQQAVDWAAERADHRSLRLHLLRAVPESSYFRQPSLYDKAVARAQLVLSRERARVSARHPSLEIVTEWQPGEPAAIFSRLSAHADMVVLGSDRPADSRGEGSGSVSFQAAMLCQSPVAVIPSQGMDGRTGVVAGFDGSADSRIALELAAEEAHRMDTALTVLHASSLPAVASARNGGLADEPALEPGKLLAAAARSVRAFFPGLTVHESVVWDASPADALIDSAEERLPSPTIVTRPPSVQSSQRR